MTRFKLSIMHQRLETPPTESSPEPAGPQDACRFLEVPMKANSIGARMAQQPIDLHPHDQPKLTPERQPEVRQTGERELVQCKSATSSLKLLHLAEKLDENSSSVAAVRSQPASRSFRLNAQSDKVPATRGTDSTPATRPLPPHLVPAPADCQQHQSRNNFSTSCQQRARQVQRETPVSSKRPEEMAKETLLIEKSRKHKHSSSTSQQQQQQRKEQDKHQEAKPAVKLISIDLVMAALGVRWFASCVHRPRRRRNITSQAKEWRPRRSALICAAAAAAAAAVQLTLALLLLAGNGFGQVKLAQAAQAPAQQYFEVQPEVEHLVLSGHDARLRCLIRSRQGECLWLRNGRAIGIIPKKYQFIRQPEDGDCSLMIRNASVLQDDGVWQCQVTAPDVEQDTLQSREVRLVVLVSPERPQIKNTSQNTHRLIMEENKTKFVVCEIRGGNPAPQIEWLLDNKNITKEAQSSSFFANSQLAANQPGQRITQSKLKMSDIKRTMNGKNLTCVGVHQTLNQSASVELDVQYVPTVSVVQREYSIVEGSPLSISCQVDANPPPNLVNWRLVSDGPSSVAARNQQQQPSITQPTRPGPVLEFERISRDLNQNIFECLAQNSYGISLPADVKLNVLYAPFLLNTSHSESVMVGSEAQLACIFDGNPEPEVKWHYTDPLSRSALPVQLDNNKQQYLSIKNVTYRNEGDYHCEARNQINGVFYGVRSSNILLDVYGEPQFLVKAPVHSKAIQGTKSDLVLAFCSDPPPNKVYWQFGSLRLDVRLNNINNGQQLPPGQVAPASGPNSKQSPVSQRFQVHPLQPLQKRDSTFSKTPTCFEAQLSILDPELTDQRDYTLVVQNDRGHAQSLVRLRVSSPLSPVLMITSAFVTICGLFLCSLIVMFLVKKRRPGSGSNSSNGHSANGHHQNGREKSPVEHLVNGKVHVNGNGNSAAAAQAAALASAAAVNAQLMQQQTRGIVNGLGNGVPNGASNPVASANGEPDTGGRMSGGGHLMSMAASDTSGDQKQLLANLDRNSSSSASSSQHASGDYDASSPAGSSRSSAQTAVATNSTPSPAMNHISVDDETNLHEADSTYQAAESVHGSESQQQLAVGGQALIYANLDYTDHHSMVLTGDNTSTLPVTGSQPATALEDPIEHSGQQVSHHHSTSHLLQHQQRQSAIQRRQQTPMEHSPTGSSLTDHSIASMLAPNATNQQTTTNSQQQQTNSSRRPASPPAGIRSSVGATIAMMNSLAAQNATTNSPNSAGGALSHQLANSRQLRKPGPPKPPKPTIQQRNRFFQQQQSANNNTGLVMIGQTNGAYSSNPMMDPSEPSANELAAEYSRIAFPARAEL